MRAFRFTSSAFPYLFGYKNLLQKRLDVPYFDVYRGLRRVRVRHLTQEEVKYNELMEFFRKQSMSETDKMVQSKKLQNESVLNERVVVTTASPLTGTNVEKKVDLPEIESKEMVNEENQHELLASKVSPLYRLPYEKQLKEKFKRNKALLKKLGAQLKECKVKFHIDDDNTPCVLDHTVPSPCLESYRNKDEFSIRPGVDGNPKTVGFFLDSPSENPNTICVPPDELCIIKDSHKRLSKEFENYIQASPLPACIHFSDGGYWRNIVVRSNAKGELMGVIIMHPRELSQEELEQEKCKLQAYFQHENRKYLNLKSLYFQACSRMRCTNAEAPFQLLFGEPYLIEEMNGCKYQISPESFFQINTPAAEKLYKIILNACKAKKNTTVLDICCGIGPVSLTFAPHVKRCIGIDVSAQAVEDARQNARLNGIENVEFHAGKCESLLENIMNELYVDELIAIVNPARSALGKAAIQSLRECRYLKKVVFISCKPEAALSNFVQLAVPPDPRGRLGASFVPLRAVPVDLFPHTEHCELVILFQRL